MASKFTVKSARRVSEILGLLAESAEGLAPAEVARVLDIPRSSAHVLLLNMAESGLIEVVRNGNGPTYRIGLRAFEIGNAYLRQRELADEARRIVNHLAASVDETAHLTILDGRDIVFVAKAESTQAMRVVTAVGRRMPAHATASGKVLLSQLDESDFFDRYQDRGLPAMTVRTITDTIMLWSQLAEVRRVGWAFDDEESTYGMQCLAVPTFQRDGRCTAALSVSMPTFRMADFDRIELLAQLHDASAAVSEHLGWPGPADGQDAGMETFDRPGPGRSSAALPTRVT